MLGSAAGMAFGAGLLATMFAFGFRHGIDWDHIAAITDITSSQEERKESILFGTLYALGHGTVVFCIGIVAIAIGKTLPHAVDDWSARVVGATLILLAVYVFVALFRHGRDFRMRSRWMLIFSGVRKGKRWVKDRVKVGSGGEDVVDVSALELAELELEEGQDPTDPSLWHHGHHGHRGHHHHASPEKDDAFMSYGKGTAFTVGMLHGIGGETPTQALLFAGLSVGSGAGRTNVEGAVVLIVFLIGLFVSNTLITVGSAYGYFTATKNFFLYASVAVATGIFSLVIGTLFLVRGQSGLPAIFGG